MWEGEEHLVPEGCCEPATAGMNEVFSYSIKLYLKESLEKLK